MNNAKHTSLARQKLSIGTQLPYLSIKRRRSTQHVSKKISGDQDMKIDLTPKQAKKKSEKLKRLVRLVIICYNWCKWAQRFYKINIHKYISFAHITQSTKFLDDLHLDFLVQVNADKRRAQMNSSELVVNDQLIENGRIRAEMMNFNLEYFRPKKRLNNKITNERIKSILFCANANKRSRKEVILVEKTIKQIHHMKFLNNLPIVMRAQFIQSCWLEEYEAKRVLVNQTRRLEFFYVIVNGSLLCTYRGENESKSRTICQLDEGMCFGEMSLLDDSINTVAVSTRGHCQLLVISGQDFLDVFYSSSSQLISRHSHRLTSSSASSSNGEDDIFEFLNTNVDFLKEFPVHLLDEDERAAVRLHRIVRGRVITESTKSSRYIYIIKSGAVTVWLRAFKDETSRLDTVEDELEMDSPKSLSYFPENLALEYHHYEMVKRSNRNKLPPKVDTLNDIIETFPVLSISKPIPRPVMARSKDKLKLPPINTISFESKTNKMNLLKVKTLFKGDYCGLNDLLFSYQPTLQLISLGCECILLPKSLFVKYSSVDQLKDLRQFAKSYPDFDTIQFALKSYAEWKNFKRDILKIGSFDLSSSSKF